MSSKKVLKKHWFYRCRPKKCLKSIGFIDVVQKSVKKALVLQIGQPKTLKNHWFYKPGNRKRWKTIGFTVKPGPGNGATVRLHRSGVWSSDTRLETLWGTLTAKLFREKDVKKALVL